MCYVHKTNFPDWEAKYLAAYEGDQLGADIEVSSADTAPQGLRAHFRRLFGKRR